MIKTHKVYYPIYTNKDKFIILITGGRASGKSHFVSSFLERLAFASDRVLRLGTLSMPMW